MGLSPGLPALRLGPSAQGGPALVYPECQRGLNPEHPQTNPPESPPKLIRHHTPYSDQSAEPPFFVDTENFEILILGGPDAKTRGRVRGLTGPCQTHAISEFVIHDF